MSAEIGWLNICDEFDCTPECAMTQFGMKNNCQNDFSKPPCIFHMEHRILNLKETLAPSSEKKEGG